MNEKELGDALLKWDATKQTLGPDPRELTTKILDRDRQRVRRLSIIAGLFWGAALLGILTIFVAGGFAFPRIAQLLQEHPAIDAGGEGGPVRALAKITAMNIVITSFSVMSLVLAGFGTMLLVRASRQATLRQVHAGLVEISEQIRQLRATNGK